MKLAGEVLGPLMFYDLVTVLCGLLFPEGGDLAVQTVSAGLTAVILLAVYRQRAADGKDGQEGRVPGTEWKSLVWQCLLLGISSSLFFNQMITLSGLKQVFPGYRQVSDQLYLPSLRLQILAMGLVIPAAEELIFRGWGYGALRERFSFPISAVLSSLLFGFYHGSVVQGIYAFAIGMVLSWSREYTGVLLFPWLVHGAANLTSVLAESMKQSEEKGAGASFFMVTAISGACLIWLIGRMNKNKEVS